MVCVRAHCSLLSDPGKTTRRRTRCGNFDVSDDAKPRAGCRKRAKWRGPLETAPLTEIVDLPCLLQVIRPNWTGIGCTVSTRCHRHHNILTFFVVEIFHTHQHLVFCEAELRPVAHRQKHRMLPVPGTNPVNHFLGLQQILLAEKFLRLCGPNPFQLFHR
jgi:hypothetical protein